LKISESALITNGVAALHASHQWRLDCKGGFMISEQELHDIATAIEDKPSEYWALLIEVEELREKVIQEQSRLLVNWRAHLRSRCYVPSAANFAAYIGLRRHDIRALQVNLAKHGLSSLGRSEGHVLGTLDAVIHTLRRMLNLPCDDCELARIQRHMTRGSQLLEKHTTRLLGKPHQCRSVRMMVTLPWEAAADPVFVRELLSRGMDCARINCAHDDERKWLKMISNVRQAEHDTGRSCKILMDLAGPKLRTGVLAPGPPVVHLTPKKDERGNVVEPARVVLDSTGRRGKNPVRRSSLPARISVPDAWLQKLVPGEVVRFQDIRGKKRRLIVQKRIDEREVMAVCRKSSYIEPGVILEHVAADQTQREVCAVGAVRPDPVNIRLYAGDMLYLTREPIPGSVAEDSRPAHIACIPSVVDQLQPGHRVWIDDGLIGATVEGVDETGALLKVFRTPFKGALLKAERGVNFPDTRLQLAPLTEKDLRDLDFIVEYADLVGYSFVQDGSAMDQLVKALEQRNASHLGILAKIETGPAFQSLPEIIIHGAGQHPFGIMIARGDLALEVGYERLPEIQEEILSLCEAAHVPVVWATQVLENMVKEGIPSRAEMTDAAMSERAECVMLNKGPYVVEAMDILNDVLARMERHQHKKVAHFGALNW
jgi:pyruvate kinase